LPLYQRPLMSAFRPIWPASGFVPVTLFTCTTATDYLFAKGNA